MAGLPARRIGGYRGLLVILAMTLAAAAAAASLPDDPHQRFSTLGATIQARIQWIYERTHYDPTPIDIAVFGPSRSGAAIDSRRLGSRLAALGRPLAAVNFSLPENGRDLHWVLQQELLRVRRPKLIVISVTEKPSRYGHPAYKYVAPRGDVVDPAYLGNINYLGNLIYLPYRQMKLATARIFPALFDLPPRYDPTRYAGTYNDGRFAFRNANAFAFHDGDQPVDPNARVDKAVLDAKAREYERGVRPPLLGERLADVEFGDERIYVARMAEAARARGIPVVFLFLPYYTGPSVIQERALYLKYGPLIDASFVKTHDEWYSDPAHLNTAGAAALTDWLAPRLAALVPGPRP